MTMAGSARDLIRDARALRGVIAQQRTAADRLQGLAIEYLRAGNKEKAEEAAKLADRCFRSAIAERDNPVPAGLDA